MVVHEAVSCSHYSAAIRSFWPRAHRPAAHGVLRTHQGRPSIFQQGPPCLQYQRHPSSSHVRRRFWSTTTLQPYLRRRLSSSTTPQKEIGGEEPPSDPLQSSQHLNPSSPSDTLPSDAERQRSHVSKRVSALMDQLQSNIFVASQRLNDLTGYSGIEALKRSIEAQEAFVQQARSAVRAAKEAYSSAIAQRSASQREVNELLQRKHAWSSQDLERFTTLYRSDHANEQAEMKAGETLAAAERTAEEAAAKLSKNILARYHEEQIWSDKIRRMSTWGTWGLMGMNILLFVVFQIAVEPWRRKRLVNGFEEKVREAMTERNEKNDPVMNDTVTTSSDQTPLFSNTNDSEIQPETSMTETSGTSTDDSMSNPLDDDDHHLPEAQNPSAQIPILGLEEDIPHSSPSSSTLERYTHPVVAGLFSAKEVTLRKFELTTLVLEGFAAGATLCAIVCVAILRSSSSSSSS